MQSPAHEASPRFNPDGTFFAYQSEQSGRWEVYVQPYPTDGRSWQISSGGGVQPIWHQQGRELTYRQGADIVSVGITPAGRVQDGAPVRLVTLEPGEQLLDAMPDGPFIVAQRPDLGTVPSLALVVNWFEDLKRRVARR